MDKRLYDLAYEFKRSKIWNCVYEEEFFAIRLGKEKYGYCCLMGRNGEHTALAVYLDSAGFSSLRKAVTNTSTRLNDLLIQDCVQCSLEKRDQFSAEELEDVLDYCKSNGITPRAPFPQFSRHKPYRMPWTIEKKSEIKAIETALEVSLALNEYLGNHTLSDVGLQPIHLEMNTEKYLDSLWHDDGEISHEPVAIPVFSVVDEKLHIDGLVSLPPFEERQMKAPEPLADDVMDEVVRSFRKGTALTLECEIMRPSSFVDGRPPYLPAILLSVDAESGMVLYPVMGHKAGYDPGRMLNEFAGMLMSAGIKPVEIRVRTRETWNLLEDFCARTGIKLIYSVFMKELDEAEEAFNSYF